MIYPSLFKTPPMPKKYLSYAQSQAFYRLDNPVGDPFMGPAYGQWESSGFFRGLGDSINSAMRSIGDAASKIFTEVIKPVGSALEKIGQSIAKDPVTFVAQVAAVATQQYWAIPLITAASTAAKGGSFEDVLKATAISAATTWVGVEGSQWITGTMQSGTVLVNGVQMPTYTLMGTSIQATTATTIGNVVGMSTAGALGAAATGKDPLSAALTNAVGAALPFALNEIPGYSSLASSVASISNTTVGRAVASAVSNTLGGAISAAATGADIASGAIKGLLGSVAQSLSQVATKVVDMFETPDFLKDIPNMSEGAKSVLAGMTTQVMASALTGGKASPNINGLFMDSFQKALGSAIKDGGLSMSNMADGISNLYQNAKNFLTGYESTKFEFEGIAEERNALADQAQQEYIDWESMVVDYEEEYATYEGLHDQFIEENQQLSDIQTYINSIAVDLNSSKSKIDLTQQKYNDVATKASAYTERLPFTDQVKASIQPGLSYYQRLFNTSDGYDAIDPGRSQLMDNWLSARGLSRDSTVMVSTLDRAEINYLKAKYDYDTNYAEQKWYAENPSASIARFGRTFTFNPSDWPTDKVDSAKAKYDQLLLQYQTWVDAANKYVKEADILKSDYDKKYEEYESELSNFEELSEAQKTKASQINEIARNLESQRSAIAVKEKALENWTGTIKEYDDQLKELDGMLVQYANDYANANKQLEEAAKPLTDVVNNFAQEAIKNAVVALDPKFNEAQYKNINGLGSGSDAYSHWLQVGKDKGLYTNDSAAATALDQQYTRLMWEMAKENGRSLISYSPEDRADLKDKIYSQYGNDLAALQKATAKTILQDSGMDANQFLSKTSAEYTPAPDWFKSFKWNQPKDYVPPDGTKLATHEDVLKGSAYQSFDSNGDVVWLTSNKSQDTRVFDKETGEMVTKITIIGSGDDDVDVEVNATRLPSTSVEDLDPVLAIDFWGSLNENVYGSLPDYLGNLNKEGIKALAEGSKIILEHAKATGNDTLYKTVQRSFDVAATGIAGVAQVVSAAGSIASIIMGTNPNDSSVQKIAGGLKEWSNAASSSEFKYATAKMEAAMKASEGGDVAGAIINNAKEFPVDFALKYIGTNLVSFLPGIGLGFAAAKGATVAGKIAGFSDDAVVALAAGTGLSTQRLYEISQEAGGAGLQAFNETRELLKKQNPSWTEAQLNDGAMQRAQIVAGSAALATLATQVVGLDKVAQNIFKGGGSSDGILTPMLTRLVSTLSETVGEAWQSYVPSQVQAILALEIDPSIDAKKAVIQETFLGAIGGMGQSAAINTLGMMQDIPAMYLNANQAFQDAVKGSSSMGQLGIVLNEWTPKDSELSTGIRNMVVPTIFQQYPQLAAPYKSAGELLDAIKNDLGVYEVTAVDVADTKFGNDVVTQKEAVKLLENKGLTNVSYEDVAKSGVMGLLTNNTATKALTYANQNMVYADDLRAAAAKENYAVTQQELDALVGRGVKADVIQQFIQEVDPKSTTLEEATQFFKDAGYNNATAAEIAEFVKSSSEVDMRQAVVSYVDPRQVTRQEAVNYFASKGYVPTEAEINQFIVQGPDVIQENIYRQIADFIDPRFTTVEEVQAAAMRQGYPMSAEEASQFAGQYNQLSKEADVEAYADKLAVLADEARQYFAAEGYTPTAEELANYVGVRNEEDAAKLIAAYADPLSMTEVEARAYLNELGYTQPTPEEVAQFVKQASESDTKTALEQYVDAHQVTRGEALNFFAEIGYTPTEAEITNYIKQGAGISQTDIKAALGAYVDPRFVDANEVREAFKALGLDAPVSQSDIARYSGQYAESDLAGRAEAGLPIVSANAMFAMVNGNPAVNQNVKDEILSKIEDYKNLGESQASAQRLATEAVAAQLNTTAGNLLTALGATENNLLVKIANVETNLTNKIDEYKASGDTQAEATSKALAEMSEQLGTTKSDLLSQLGTTENNLIVRLASTKQELADKIDQYRSEGFTQAEATKKALDEMSAQIGINKADILATLGATESNLVSKITANKEELLDRVAEYRAQGLAENAALQKAMEDLSGEFGTSKEQLLAQIGTTETALRNELAQQVTTLSSQLQAQIKANMDAGMASDAALQKAIADVAAQANTTAENLLAQMGTNTQQLQAQIAAAQQAGQQYTQQQVSDATKQIQDQMALYEQAGYDRDTALSLAISTVAQDLGTTKSDFLSQLGTTESNLRTEFTSGLIDVKNSILAKVAEYQQQGYSSDQALQAAIDTVSQSLGTTRSDLLSQIGTTETQLRGEIATQVGATEQRLADLIAKNETEGMARDQATQAAINTLTTELGTTRTDLLSRIDITSQQFQNEITIAKTDLANQLTVYGQQTQQQIAQTKAEIKSQMDAYEQAGIDRDTALDLAINGVAQDLGVAKNDLLSRIGTTEANLRSELTAQTQALSTQVQDIAKLLGKPASQVTANDVTMVQNMIDQQMAADLAYDTNNDGKIDLADLTAIQNQLAVQQNTNIVQQVDPITGMIVNVDKSTGKVVQPWAPTGSKWTPTGIYEILEKQKMQAATSAAAQAKQAKTAQQRGQFGQLMNMLFQAPDAGGQQVTVKTPDPAKINYIYDWSSIFATPSQAGLMPSPYGQVNNVMPQPKQPQQAANQPLFNLASGFAEGGIVNSNDIQVGGNGIDDLINILKGN